MPSINNDQNISRVCSKMSEDFHDENNSSKLTNCANRFENLNEINIAESDSSDEEEIHVVNNLYPYKVKNGDTSELLIKNPPFKCNCQTSAESEVKIIREWFFLHSDLIQLNNDEILDKDREVYHLRKENEMLKEKISCLEKGIPFQINDKPSSEDIQQEVILEDMTQSPLKEEVHEEVQVIDQLISHNDDSSAEIIDYTTDNCVSLLNCESQTSNAELLSGIKYEENSVNSETELNSEEIIIDNINSSWKNESDFNLSDNIEVSEYRFSVNNISEFDPMKNLRMSIRRKRVTSNSSGLSHNESVSLEEKRTYRKRFKKKKRSE